MSLGPNETICKQEYIAAMRARMEADQPGSGANMDNPDVQKTFDSFGLALYRVMTVQAETKSNAAADAAFWAWIAQVNAWLGAMSVWQKGVAQAFSNWNAVTPQETALKTAITSIASPPAPPVSPPVSLKGKIE